MGRTGFYHTTLGGITGLFTCLAPVGIWVLVEKKYYTPLAPHCHWEPALESSPLPRWVLCAGDFSVQESFPHSTCGEAKASWWKEASLGWHLRRRVLGERVHWRTLKTRRERRGHCWEQPKPLLACEVENMQEIRGERPGKGDAGETNAEGGQSQTRSGRPDFGDRAHEAFPVSWDAGKVEGAGSTESCGSALTSAVPGPLMLPHLGPCRHPDMFSARNLKL